MFSLPPTNRPWTMSAAWIFPVEGDPVRNGVITIQRDRILSVGVRVGETVDLDLGDVALVPGLVNAHTHLDLTGFAGQCPPCSDFPAWLAEVLKARGARSEAQVQLDIQQGIHQSLQAGVTLVGDISATGESWRAIEATKLRATVYPEVLGLSLERNEATWTRAEAIFENARQAIRCRFGLSPHSPYTATQSLLKKAAASARDLCIHYLESASEVELLEKKRGKLFEFLGSRGLKDPHLLADSIQTVADLVTDAPSVLWAHANYWHAGILLPPQSTVVYCPRTHAAFGHPPHPFMEMLRFGIPVVLGTDSLATNPDLSIWEEARFVAALYPHFSRSHLLHAITLDSARALGWGDLLGSFTPGKLAHCVVFPLKANRHDMAEPYGLLWQDHADPLAVMVDGVWISAGEDSPSLPRNQEVYGP